MFLLSCIVAAVVCCIICGLWKYYGKSKEQKTSASVIIVAGSGGHTSEMLQLVQSLDHHYRPRIYLVATTDVVSEKKILAFEEKRSSNLHQPESDFVIVKIPRAREVHQSWLTTVLTTLKSCLFSVPVVFKWKPDLILCNGPGTCIPVCLIGIIFKILRITFTQIIYVESICRVQDLSLSGKLLYPFADHLIVQWPELCKKYQKAVYLGRLVG